MKASQENIRKSDFERIIKLRGLDMELIDQKIEGVRKQLYLIVQESSNEKTIDLLQTELEQIKEDRRQL